MPHSHDVPARPPVKFSTWWNRDIIPLVRDRNCLLDPGDFALAYQVALEAYFKGRRDESKFAYLDTTGGTTSYELLEIFSSLLTTHTPFVELMSRYIFGQVTDDERSLITSTGAHDAIDFLHAAMVSVNQLTGTDVLPAHKLAIDKAIKKALRSLGFNHKSARKKRYKKRKQLRKKHELVTRHCQVCKSPVITLPRTPDYVYCCDCKQGRSYFIIPDFSE